MSVTTLSGLALGNRGARPRFLDSASGVRKTRICSLTTLDFLDHHHVRRIPVTRATPGRRKIAEIAIVNSHFDAWGYGFSADDNQVFASAGNKQFVCP
jgi:hypothetical protein